MKKRILITTAMERSTRILLRSALLSLLIKEYEVVVSSPAEKSEEWKTEFAEEVLFLSDLTKGSSYHGLNIYNHYNIVCVISTCNNDVPAHGFDVSYQMQAVNEGIPVVIIQDFIDTIFHPMQIIPDKYLCWGGFFKTHLSNPRDVMYWDNSFLDIGGLTDYRNTEPLHPDTLDICGSVHFDDYIKHQDVDEEDILYAALGFDKSKPVLLYTPTGCQAEWVYKTIDDLFQVARDVGGQVVVKAHPIRHDDAWIYNLVASKYPEIPFSLQSNRSFGKGKARVSGYQDGAFKLGYEDSIQLKSLLTLADVTVSIGSTSNVEGMIFNTPCVLNSTYWDNGWGVRKNIMNAYWNLLSEGFKCCDIARDQKSFTDMVIDNLDNPQKNKEGRETIVKEFFYEVDGQSGQRCFDSIQSLLEGDKNDR